MPAALPRPLAPPPSRRKARLGRPAVVSAVLAPMVCAQRTSATAGFILLAIWPVLGRRLRRSHPWIESMWPAVVVAVLLVLGDHGGRQRRSRARA